MEGRHDPLPIILSLHLIRLRDDIEQLLPLGLALLLPHLNVFMCRLLIRNHHLQTRLTVSINDVSDTLREFLNENYILSLRVLLIRSDES